jgi:hypothetical protein
VFETLPSAGYRYAMNHLEACMIVIFVVGTRVLAQPIGDHSRRKFFASIPQLLVETFNAQPVASRQRQWTRDPESGLPIYCALTVILPAFHLHDNLVRRDDALQPGLTAAESL